MWNITADTFLTKSEECLTYIKNNWDQIPLLNCTPDYNVSDGHLVRFCGMIQDMPDPVYYFSAYEVLNNTTGLKETKSGKYRDSLRSNPNETLILDSENCQNGETQLYCCISIPGLNDWAQPKFKESSECKINSASSSANKRSVEDMEVESSGNSADAGSNKRLCTSPSVVKTDRPQFSQQNFPIADSKNYSCIVYVYDSVDSPLKVNDIIEICGFIHFTPQTIHNDDTPPSNIPRLHAVHLMHVKSFTPFRSVDSIRGEILNESRKLRSELHLVLSQMLLGDSLAADYLICHLLAHIYGRIDCTVLGKFSVNLSNIPVNDDYITNLYKLLTKLLPKTHYLPMSLQTMNTTQMLPKKDYELNRLESGMLQLSDHTHLVIDETKLQVGKLEETGVKNVQTLKCLIQHQKLDYDFKFFTVEFLTDIPVLILSEGKSLLPSDCHVVLKYEEDFMNNSLRDNFQAIEQYLQESLLNQLRDYLAVTASVSDFILPDHLQQIIENDLVEQRQAGERTSAEDFHARLVLARLLSLSYGESTLSKSVWDKTGEMEANRKLRLNIRNR